MSDIVIRIIDAEHGSKPGAPAVCASCQRALEWLESGMIWIARGERPLCSYCGSRAAPQLMGALNTILESRSRGLRSRF